ncbi:hypothetical protein HDK77DRAFT_442 [Phyllosticta capitalensis]
MYIVNDPSTHAPTYMYSALPCPARSSAPGTRACTRDARTQMFNANKRQAGRRRRRAGRAEQGRPHRHSGDVATEARALRKSGESRGAKRQRVQAVAVVSLTSFLHTFLVACSCFAGKGHAAAWTVDAKVPGHWQLRIDNVPQSPVTRMRRGRIRWRSSCAWHRSSAMQNGNRNMRRPLKHGWQRKGEFRGRMRTTEAWCRLVGAVVSSQATAQGPSCRLQESWPARNTHSRSIRGPKTSDGGSFQKVGKDVQGR